MAHANAQQVISFSRCRTIEASYTRPADTAAYTAGDVLSNSTTGGTSVPLTFSGIDDLPTYGGLSFVLQSVTVTSSANQATKPDLRLWLLDTTISDLDGDNAAFTPTDTQIKTALHVIEFPAAAWLGGDATSGAGGNSICNAQALWLPINTVAGSASIFGVFEVRNAYTPVSGEVFNVRLGILL